MWYLLLIFQQVSGNKSNFVSVTTVQGEIVGEEIRTRYGALYIFTGVPYAMVDEDNKFGEALPYPNNRTVNTFESCPQIDSGGIQCLTLNILTPIIKYSDKYPVLIWFYGGFMMRNPQDYDGRHIAKHGVIVVTVNYRLGPYGFFCLETIKNQGLKDQSRAIKWVKNNIEAFNGNPEEITIGGQSYGGGAVDFHLYDEERHFNKAIIQSGSRFAKGITSVKDNGAPVKLAMYFGSNATDTKEALRFLNGLDPVSVMIATKDLNMKFGVCKDKYDYVDHIKDTAILIGYNSNEDLATYALQPEEFYQNLPDVFYEYLSQNFHVDNATLHSLTRIVKKFYLGSENITKDAMLGLADFSSDSRLNLAVERSVKRFLAYNATKVYKYLFSYTGRSLFKSIRGVGATHAEELQYLFDKNSDNMFTAEQIVLRDRMTKMWANFVKYGNPNLLRHYKRTWWRPTNSEQRYYFNIDKEMFLAEHLFHKRMAFWELLMSFYKYILKNKANKDDNISSEQDKHNFKNKVSITERENLEIFNVIPMENISFPNDEYKSVMSNVNDAQVEHTQTTQQEKPTTLLEKPIKRTNEITTEDTVTNRDELTSMLSGNKKVIENPMNEEQIEKLGTTFRTNEVLTNDPVVAEPQMSYEHEPEKSNVKVTLQEQSNTILEKPIKTTRANEITTEDSVTNRDSVIKKIIENIMKLYNEERIEKLSTTFKTNKVSTDDPVMVESQIIDIDGPEKSNVKVTIQEQPKTQQQKTIKTTRTNEINTEDPVTHPSIPKSGIKKVIENIIKIYNEDRIEKLGTTLRTNELSTNDPVMAESPMSYNKHEPEKSNVKATLQEQPITLLQKPTRTTKTNVIITENPVTNRDESTTMLSENKKIIEYIMINDEQIEKIGPKFSTNEVSTDDPVSNVKATLQEQPSTLLEKPARTTKTTEIITEDSVTKRVNSSTILSPSEKVIDNPRLFEELIENVGKLFKTNEVSTDDPVIAEMSYEYEPEKSNVKVRNNEPITVLRNLKKIKKPTTYMPIQNEITEIPAMNIANPDEDGYDAQFK